MNNTIKILLFTSFIFLIAFTVVKAIDNNNDGYQLSPGETINIDVHDESRSLTNNGSNTYFIPTRTAAEWTSFINNAPTDISIVVDIDCAGTPFGTNWESDCGCVPASNDGNDCDDCNNIPDGIAYLDNCNNCVAGDTGITACTADCSGTWGGSATTDACGECGGTNTECLSNGITCSADVQCSSDYCYYGCCGGSSYIDACGVCGGSGPSYNCGSSCGGIQCGSSNCSSPPTNYNCSGSCVVDTDCSGVCGGSSMVDACGVCNGSITCLDCNGVPNGSAYMDNCGTCDTNSGNDCTQDCAGTWGGSAYTDNCGSCDTNSGNDCTQDACGIWGGDGSTCCAGSGCGGGFDCVDQGAYFDCVDINECATNNGNCGTGYSCQNTAGSYSCNQASCPANASGAPSCACNSGYSGTLSWNGSSWSGTCSVSSNGWCLCYDPQHDGSYELKGPSSGPGSNNYCHSGYSPICDPSLPSTYCSCEGGGPGGDHGGP